MDWQIASIFVFPDEKKSMVLGCCLNACRSKPLVPATPISKLLSLNEPRPECHARVSFVALRDAASLPAGAGARNFFIERFVELTGAVETLPLDEAGRIAKAVLIPGDVVDDLSATSPGIVRRAGGAAARQKYSYTKDHHPWYKAVS